MHLYELQADVLGLVWAGLSILKIFVLVDAVLRPPAAFAAADKQSKAFWLWVLGLTLVAHLLYATPLGLLSLIGTIAAFVYLLDARPALISVTRRR